jgi:hypothetical protein
MYDFGLLSGPFWDAIQQQNGAPATGLLGLSNQSVTGPSWQSIADGLAAASQSLLSGRRMSPLQAIGTGFGAGALGARQSVRDQRQGALEDLQIGGYLNNLKQAQAKKEAIDAYIAGQPVDQQAGLRAAAASGALDSVISDQYRPFKPDLQTIYHGSQAEQGYYDRSGKWVQVGGGPRFEGQQPQRLPLDATVYDQSANGGQGGYVYVGGPLKGQLARPGRESPTVTPSDVIGPIMAKQARGEPLTPAEQATLDSYRTSLPWYMSGAPASGTGMSVPAASAAPPPVPGTQFGHPNSSAVPASSGSSQTGDAAGSTGNLYGPGSRADNAIAVQSAADAAKLPPGTYFKTPDGRVIRRN